MQHVTLSNIPKCGLCPALREYCAEVARKKKREFSDKPYWGKPVPSLGGRKARLWIIGLAPAAHGANRTGRMFTGDSSGQWLFRKLYKYGFSSQELSIGPGDGLEMNDVYISAVIHCAPPLNKPKPNEIKNCEAYLDKEFNVLKHKQLILALGGIAFRSTLGLLKRQGYETKGLSFGHGAYYNLGDLGLLASYHPSRQNTNTGRLTDKMWDDIFRFAKKTLRKSFRG